MWHLAVCIVWQTSRHETPPFCKLRKGRSKMQISHTHLFSKKYVDCWDPELRVCTTYVALKFRSLLVMKLFWCVRNHMVVTLTLLKFLLVAVLGGNSQSSKTARYSKKSEGGSFVLNDQWWNTSFIQTTGWNKSKWKSEGVGVIVGW